MKHLLAFISLLFATLTTQAANPAFQDFFGTNGIVIRTNGNKVQVDGQFLTNGASAVYFTTNLFATNIYVSNIVAQFITVESNLFVNNTITTNLTVVNNSYTSNLFATNIFVNQTLVTSNIFVTNLFAGNTYTTNLFATNITVQNTYVSNIFTTNIFVEQTTVVSNLYATNIFVDNFYSTNIITTNLTVNNTVTENLFVTTNITVVQNAYISNIVTEVNQTVINITSNLYVTNIIAGTIISKDILWTNDNGTVRLIDEGRLGLGTNAGDAMFLIEVGTNAINAIKYSTNGLTLFMVKSNGDLSTIRGVAYAWPNAQGGAGTALTNDGSGNLGWSASVGSVTLGMLRTNIFTTNIQGSPVVGTLWLQGTTGSVPTNGARTALEYVPAKPSLRVGVLFGNGSPTTSSYTNFWDETNQGSSSYVFGSNNMVRGHFGSILGGALNAIETNSNYGLIVGGTFNVLNTNSHSATIVGGTNNNIGTNSSYSFIGGGEQHTARGVYSTIGGGYNNRIQPTLGGGQNNTIAGGSGNLIDDTAVVYSFIGGGLNNNVHGSYNVVGGGNGNQIPGSGASVGPSYATISGGNANFINQQGSANTSTGGTIGGGQNNSVGDSASGGAANGTISGGSNNKLIGNSTTTDQNIAGGSGNFVGVNSGFGSISGGKSNQIQASVGPSFIAAGVSNNVTAFGGAIGFWSTNATAGEVMISVFTTNGLRINSLGPQSEGIIRTKAGRGTAYAGVGGTISVATTPVVNAGTAETNLMTFTVPANTLTNTSERLKVRASGRFAATADAKQIKLIWGSETILDTTSQIQNDGAWTITAEIIRTGNTAQMVNANYVGSGMALFTLASSGTIAQTNGIATVLKLTGTCGASGVLTNNTLTVEWMPTSF